MTVKEWCKWLWGGNSFLWDCVVEETELWLWMCHMCHKSSPHTPHSHSPHRPVLSRTQWAWSHPDVAVQVWCTHLGTPEGPVELRSWEFTSALQGRCGLCVRPEWMTLWVPGQPALQHYMPSLILPSKSFILCMFEKVCTSIWIKHAECISHGLVSMDLGWTLCKG